MLLVGALIALVSGGMTCHDFKTVCASQCLSTPWFHLLWLTFLFRHLYALSDPLEC